MIPKETIEKIKEAMDVVEVIDDFVQLKKSGSSYKGFSPFKQEKTPSFFVSPAKQIFKDFSTGKGGDAITFLIEAEGMNYVEALRYLAGKYGIEIQEEEETQEQILAKTEKESLLIILNYAKEYYAKLLFEHQEGKAIGLSYFKERGFQEAIIKKFELGYSLDVWDAFTKEAIQKQYSEELLDKSGLTIFKEGGKKYDRFRGRVIFPIHNTSGKVIAFGARTLKKDKNLPKYVNSPETIVYHKSDVLYGLYQAKQSIRQEENCYLVEGYTDVVSLHQAGITNVVASSGTSLTEGQIRQVKRFADTMTVLYDGDSAGIKASMRGIDMILEQGMKVQAVVFPEGEDPDSYVKSIGADAFKQYLEEKKTDFITFKTQLFLEDAKGDPIKKAEVITQVVESISKVPNAIQRQVFFQHCSNLLSIEEQVLISEYNKIVLKRQQQKEKAKYKPKPKPKPPTQDTSFPPLPPDSGVVPPLADEDYYAQEPQEEGYDAEVYQDYGEENVPELASPAIQVVEKQERSLARLLLNYGSFELENDIFLAQHIVEEIEEIDFKDPVVVKVVQAYKTAIDNEEKLPNLHYFLEDTDQHFKDAVTDLVTNKHELSGRWEDHEIYTPKEEDVLSKTLFNSVLRLKWKQIKALQKENYTKLANASTDEEIMECQQLHIELKKVEMNIAKQLGNVISS